MRKIKLVIATELGFCFGVKRSIDIAMSIRAKTDLSVTILNQLVHNRDVLRSLAIAGIGQVSDLDDATDGKLLISAHGAPPAIIEKAKERGLDVVDTTCPLVSKVHDLVEVLSRSGHHIIVFGDPDHDEIRGIAGHLSADQMTVASRLSDIRRVSADKLALISQTTLDVEEFRKLATILRSRYPGIQIYNTICKPTRRRQEAAADLARQCELVIVVGSPTSANSVRLAEITRGICGRSLLIEHAEQVSESQLDRAEVVGLTAGASSPDPLIRSVIRRLCRLATVELVTDNPDFAESAKEARDR